MFVVDMDEERSSPDPEPDCWRAASSSSSEDEGVGLITMVKSASVESLPSPLRAVTSPPKSSCPPWLPAVTVDTLACESR